MAGFDAASLYDYAGPLRIKTNLYPHSVRHTAEYIQNWEHTFRSTLCVDLYKGASNRKSFELKAIGVILCLLMHMDELTSRSTYIRICCRISDFLMRVYFFFSVREEGFRGGFWSVKEFFFSIAKWRCQICFGSNNYADSYAYTCMPSDRVRMYYLEVDDVKQIGIKSHSNFRRILIYI